MVRISACSVDVTPDRRLDLGGSWSRNGPLRATGVDERLEANMLLIEASGQHVLLLSIDALFAGPDLAGDLAAQCLERGRPTKVFALASHTHRAPMLDRKKACLGRFDKAWYGEVVLRLASGVEGAIGSLGPGATVSIARGDVGGGVCRRAPIRRPVLHGRRIVRSGTLMGPNPDRPCAPACRAAVLRYDNGSIACVIVSWACHPASYPVPDRVTPDFVGSVRRAIRSRLGKCPVLFLQGFSGDVCPRIAIKVTPRTTIRHLLRGPVFATPTLDEWTTWADRVGTEIADIVSQAEQSTRACAEEVRVREAAVPLSALLGDVERGSCRASLLTLGQTVKLFMVTAEVSAEYAPLVEQLGFWPVGCMDDVFGYLPADAQLSSGGYEVDEFRSWFGIRGRFMGRNDAAFASLLQALGPE